MEQTTSTAALPTPPRRDPSVDRPDDAKTGGALHPLEERRVRAGFDTRQALADASSVSRNQIANIEDGVAERPRISTIRKLAGALKVDTAQLLGELRNPTAGVTSDQPVVVHVEAKS